MKKSRQKQKINLLCLFLRYLILIIFGISLSLFYKLFLPLTIHPASFLLNLLYEISVTGNIISIAGTGIKIEIINACVAGSAYYLLLILNLTTSMKPKQRLLSLLFSFSSFLALNIIRIFLLSVLYIENSAFFSFTHKLFWYALSTLFVIGIWFLTVKIFKIKKVPVYSDIKNLLIPKEMHLF